MNQDAHGLILPRRDHERQLLTNELSDRQRACFALDSVEHYCDDLAGLGQVICHYAQLALRFKVSSMQAPVVLYRTFEAAEVRFEGLIKIAGGLSAYTVLLSILHLHNYLSYIFHSHMQDLFVHIFVEQGTVLIDNCENLFIQIDRSRLYLNRLDLLVFLLSRCVVLKGILHEYRKYLS